MKQSARLFVALLLLTFFAPTVKAEVTAEFYNKDGVSTLFRYKRSLGSLYGLTVIKYFRVTSGSGYIYLTATLDETGNSTVTKMWVEEGIGYQAELDIDFSGSPRYRSAVHGEKCFTATFDADALSTPGTGTFYAQFEPPPSSLGNWCPRTPVITAGELDEFQVNASDGDFADHVRITWNEIAGATSYQVYRCKGSQYICDAPIGFPVSNGFDDTGGADEVSYNYFVRACTAGECGDFSLRDTGFRSDGLDDHGNSCAEATPVEINSTTPGFIEKAEGWSDRSTKGDYDYFKIYVHAAGTLTVSSSDSTETFSRTDTFGTLLDDNCNEITNDNNDGDFSNFLISRELEAGTYYASVRGYWWALGAYEFVSSFDGPPAPAPGMPGGVIATDGKYTDRVGVTFNPVDGATFYQVHRCMTAAQASCGAPVGSPDTNSYDDTGAVPGTVYYYRVVACHSTACGPFSAANAGFARAIPAPPTGINATDGDYEDRTRVSWDAVAAAMAYRVYRCTGPGSETCSTMIGSTKMTGFDDPGCASGKKYWYRAKACAAGDCSAFSEADEGYRGELPPDRTWLPVNRFVSFDGDKKADVLLRHLVSAQWHINFMNWRLVLPKSGGTPMFANPNWEMMGTGDFNGDGRGDLLLRHKVTGIWWIYLMNGRVVNGGKTLINVDPDWIFAGIDDFDGDGKDDVLLRHRVTGKWTINFMNWRLVRPNSGLTPIFANLAWEMMGTGDFNGDGRGDVLLRNKLTGAWWMFLMNGRSKTHGKTLITLNPNWVIAGIDDFDGDGKDDVMLRQQLTGQWQINFMDSQAVLPHSGIPRMFTNLDWEMMGSGDFNRDGRGDVLLRNIITGAWWVYLMNGLSFNGGATSITMDLDWDVSRFSGGD